MPFFACLEKSVYNENMIIGPSEPSASHYNLLRKAQKPEKAKITKTLEQRSVAKGSKNTLPQAKTAIAAWVEDLWMLAKLVYRSLRSFNLTTVETVPNQITKDAKVVSEKKEFSKNLNKTIKNGILANRTQNPDTTSVKIDDLTINLSNQFIRDLPAINFFIADINGEQQTLFNETESMPDEISDEYIIEQKLKGLLHFLGYQGSENLTEEQIAANEAAIKTLENLSFSCNQWIGTETNEAVNNLKDTPDYPLQLDNGTKFMFQAYNMGTNIILSRTQDGGFTINSETVPIRSPWPFDQIVKLENSQPISIKPDASDFYAQTILSLDSEGNFKKVESGSWKYTIVEVENQEDI